MVEIIQVVEQNLTLLLCSMIILLLLSVVTISIYSVKTTKKIKKQISINRLDHNMLMKNQNHLNLAIRKLDTKLKEDSDRLRLIKTILVQRVIPLMSRDKVVQKLTEDINKLESNYKISQKTITDLSVELKEIKDKYKRTKEELEFMKTTIPIQKI